MNSMYCADTSGSNLESALQFAKANSEELGVKCVPSLNLVFTEEEGYVTADVAEQKDLVSSDIDRIPSRLAL